MYSHQNFTMMHYDLTQLYEGPRWFAILRDKPLVAFWGGIILWPITVSIMAVFTALGQRPQDWFTKA